MDPALRARLIEWLGVEEVQVYDVEGMLDLGDLWQIAGLEGHSEVRHQPWTPLTHGSCCGFCSLPERQGRSSREPSTAP